MKPETVTVRKRDLLVLGRALDKILFCPFWRTPTELQMDRAAQCWNKIAVQAGIADPEPPPPSRDGKETGGAS